MIQNNNARLRTFNCDSKIVKLAKLVTSLKMFLSTSNGKVKTSTIESRNSFCNRMQILAFTLKPNSIKSCIKHTVNQCQLHEEGNKTKNLRIKF